MRPVTALFGASILSTLALVLPAPAAGAERVVTLFSPKLESQPFVHRTTTVALRPNGREAPARAGYVLAFKEMVLVDSKDPAAKPLPLRKMMVHHLLYFAPDRVDTFPGGGCFGGGFLGGRGEEHPRGRFEAFSSPEARARYGIHNALADGSAPSWQLTAMVMNHYGKPKDFYIRTRLWYTTEPRAPLLTTIVGDCSRAANGMAYDVPGGSEPSSEFRDSSEWRVPEGFNGRILGAASHQHGGALHQSLASETCARPLLAAPAYYGDDDHPYNTIRPILHEPGPIANGTFRSAAGIPITSGEVIRREAVHDNTLPHVAAMGFWSLQIVEDESVAPCAPLPTDLREVSRPPRWDQTSPFVYQRPVPQLRRPSGAWRQFTGRALTVADRGFRPQRVEATLGQRIKWRFSGFNPHTVTVANGPRGFSSNYNGYFRGAYSFRPTTAGTYRLVCLIHPTTMSQTLVVRPGAAP